MNTSFRKQFSPKLVLLAVSLLFLATSAQARLYKCPGDDGAYLYQSSPCPGMKERVMSEEDIKREAQILEQFANGIEDDRYKKERARNIEQPKRK